MATRILDLIRTGRVPKEEDDVHESDELSLEEEELFEVCLAWKLGDEDLERNPKVKGFLDLDPDHLKVVRSLQLLLHAGRLKAASEQAARNVHSS